MHRHFPTYKTLLNVVKKTFTAEAVFLPQRLELWTSLPEDTPKRIVRKRSNYIGHDTVKVAVGTNFEWDELHFSTCYNKDLYQAVTVVNKTRWSEEIFEVMCFDPEAKDSQITLQKWTNLEFQLLWGETTIDCQAIGNFYAEGTRVKQSFLESAATCFVNFLTLEFPAYNGTLKRSLTRSVYCVMQLHADALCDVAIHVV